jgi:NADP-dependent 3-hydroxy acid dehydrogenase YdfG
LKNVLITGAGSGLGKELALHFSKNGWSVIATMIHLDHGKDLHGLPNIKCYVLDVTSTEIIENTKIELLNKYKTIDVIINNAGIGYRSFVELAEDDKINSIVDINWLGVVKVCRAFIPVFRSQGHGLFINISSIAGLVNLPLGSFYHSTKKAVESFSECMAYELIDFNIKVCTVQFGNANTNFQKSVIKSEQTAIESYNVLMTKITDLLNKKTSKNKDLLPKITNKIFDVAQNPPAKFKRYTIGFDANAMKILRWILGYRLFNVLIRRSVL